MASPFDVTDSGGDSDAWRNLMAFGLATMAAGAQPGARTLGAVGQGGLAAMDSARQNALARSQTQLTGADIQSKKLQNMLALRQVNMQNQMFGLPQVSMDGIPGMASPIADANTPPVNSGGMPTSPAAGTSPMAGRSNGPTPAPQTAAGASSLAEVVMGRRLPSSPEEAAQAAMLATSAGYNERAQFLNKYAYDPSIAANSKWAQLPAEIAQITATPREVPAGGGLYQDGQIIARGGMDGVTPAGTPYKIPAQATGAQGGQDMPMGIRNNNPTNLRPSGDKWQGMTGENGGYLTFATPEDGIRAASKNLQSYSDRGMVTPMQIASNWAPKGDGKNDPEAYGVNLAEKLGVDPLAPLNLKDPATNAAVVAAITHNENSMLPYSPDQIMKGVTAAFASEPKQETQGGDVPQGAVQTGLSPGSKAFQEERSKTLATRMNEWDERAVHAKEGNFLIDQMRDESQSWRMGKWGEAQGNAQSYLQTFAHAFLPEGEQSKWDKPAGDFQAFQKNAGQLTRQAVREVSSRAAVQEYQMIQKSLPSADMSRGGFEQVAGQMQSLYDYDLAKQSAAQNWLKSHPTAEGFETDFNKNITPAVFLVNRMSPQDLQGMRDNLLKNPSGKLVLDGLIKKIQYAKENGLIE